MLTRVSISRYLLCGLALGLFWGPGRLNLAVAGESPSATETNSKQNHYAEAKTRRRQAVGQHCGSELEAAQNAIANEQWPKAGQILSSASESACVSSFEKSQVWNYLGYVYFSEQDYRKALTTYLKLINEPEVDAKMKLSAYNTVAQLHFQLEDYASAATFMERWMNIVKSQDGVIDAHTKAVLAQAYYQLGRKAESSRYLQEAIADFQAKGKLPPENWWSLQSLLYFEQQQYQQALPVLKQLIKHYPRYRYWHQLGGVYGQLGKDLERLVATEIVYLAGALSKERELVSLAYLYLGANTPYLAAKTLDTAIQNGEVAATTKHLELLGQAWQQAGEGLKARPVLEKAAAQSEQGNIYAQLASVYLDIGDNASAVAAAQKAFKKGGLKREGSLRLVEGTALLNLHCYGKAIEAFEQAGKHKASAVNARQWLRYARAEHERIKSLLAAGAEPAACGV